MKKGTRTRVEVATVSLPKAAAPGRENQDSLGYFAGEGHPDDWADLAAVVADGVGSSKEPVAAAHTAVESWLRFVEYRFTERPEELARFDKAQLAQVMRECFAQAHRQVQRNAPGGSATAAGVCIQGPWLLAATVGDSRVYHVSGNQIGPATSDRVDASGNPTEVLGGRVAAPNAESYAEVALQPGDWVILASDGLAKTLALPELLGLLQRSDSPAVVAQGLQQLILNRKTPDDVTAVIVRILETGDPFWGPAPAFSSTPVPAPGPVVASPSPGKERKTAMRTSSPNGDPASLEELEGRIARLERSPQNGGLSPQDQARLEREFGRLEQQIQRLEGNLRAMEDAPGHRAGSTSLWVAGALIVGLALGWGLSSFRDRRAGDARTDGTTAGDPGSAASPVSFKIQLPPDVSRVLNEQITERGIVIRYQNADGNPTVLLFPYDGKGKPSLSYRLPKTSDATIRELPSNH